MHNKDYCCTKTALNIRENLLCQCFTYFLLCFQAARSCVQPHKPMIFVCCLSASNFEKSHIFIEGNVGDLSSFHASVKAVGNVPVTAPVQLLPQRDAGAQTCRSLGHHLLQILRLLVLLKPADDHFNKYIQSFQILIQTHTLQEKVDQEHVRMISVIFSTVVFDGKIPIQIIA